MTRNLQPLILTIATLTLIACPRAAKHLGEHDGNGDAGGSDRFVREHHDSAVEVDDAFRPCDDHADCVLVGVDCNGCCGRDAIAARFESVYERSHENACRGYRGPECDCAFAPLEARCVDSMCRAVSSPVEGDYRLARLGTNVLVTAPYRDCQQDADCSLVSISCDGCCQRDAITSTLESTYDTNFAAACADYRGAICDCNIQPAEARCIDAVCTHVALDGSAANGSN